MQIYPELRTAAPTSSSQCTELELTCSSCSELSMHINTSIGFITPGMQCNTAAGEYCNKYMKRCSTRKSYCSLGGEFQCHQEGRFPHPFECTVYFACMLDGSGAFVVDERICSFGTSYNAKTQKCERSTDDPTCEGYPVPECPDSSCHDIYPLHQNPNIFYTCDGGLPQLYKCIEGEDYYYHPELFQCVKNGTEQTTTTTTTETPDKCLPPYRKHVPYTCKHYFNCEHLPSPLWYYCGKGKYFNREKGKCEEGDCPYDDDTDTQALCNLLTGTYPLPGHCNSYYKCDNGTFEAVGGCQNLYYFDRDLEECVKGPCPYNDFQK